MFGVVTPDILIILCLVLLLFRPQELPQVARQIGRALRELRKMTDEVRNQLKLDD